MSIGLTNGVKVSSQNLELLGIDVSNILASNFSTYTATQDCFIKAHVDSGDNFSIDNVQIQNVYAYQGTSFFTLFYLKDGQTFKTSDNNTTAYGLK